MGSQFSELMSKHSDKKLQDIIANRKKYDLQAYKAAVEEFQKRENEKKNQKESDGLGQKKPDEFVSKYVAKDFFYRVSFRYMAYVLFSFVASFLFTALFSNVPQVGHSVYRNYKREVVQRILTALSYMTESMVLIALSASLFFSVGLIWWTRMKNSSKRIIVYMHFNDALKILFIKVRYINEEHLVTCEIPYGHLQLKYNEKSSDGMNFKSSYSAIEIYNGSMYIGELLEDHFTWDFSDFENIRTKLELTSGMVVFSEL